MQRCIKHTKISSTFSVFKGASQKTSRGHSCTAKPFPNSLCVPILAFSLRNEVKQWRHLKKMRKKEAVQFLIIASWRADVPLFLFSKPFINRPYLKATKTTNYCEKNVSCGGPPFDAWFVFVFRPPCSFVLPPVPVCTGLASGPGTVAPTVVSSWLIYIILYPIWMTPAERWV